MQVHRYEYLQDNRRAFSSCTVAYHYQSKIKEKRKKIWMKKQKKTNKQKNGV